MKRSCKVCHKSKNEAYFACGYLPPGDRRKVFQDFPLYQDPHFGVDICPIWYYNEYSYIYRIYNMVKKGSTNVMGLPFHERFIFQIADAHNGLVELDRAKTRALRNKR